MRKLGYLAALIFLLPSTLHAQVGDGRIYVKRIVFLGTDRIDDAVLRRELTQLEGTYLDTVALEKSRLQLERLPFVSRAAITRRPVKDAPDQVDVLITITEAPARQYRVGGAFSESLRFSGFVYYLDENLFGNGQRLLARLDASEIHNEQLLSHTDPYVGAYGVSRTIALSARRFDQLTADTTDLEGDLLSARLEYGYRVAERQSIRFGIAIHDVELETGTLVSAQLENWVSNNGSPTLSGAGAATDYLTAEFLFGWHHDTRDRKIFPSTGLEQQVNLKIAIPGSEIEYYTFDYNLRKYWPLKGGWSAKIATRFGYGEKYGSGTTSLAPNLNWFAGGPGSVRGYRENRLGPIDSLGNPYGGNLFVSNQLELMMPLPEKWRRRTRIGVFYDIGNVFSTENVSFLDDVGDNLDYSFEFSELRQSVGIAAEVITPLGALRLSYGAPLNAKDDNPNRFLRDDVQRFQIAIGTEF